MALSPSATSSATSADADAEPIRRDGWTALCVGVYLLLGLALIARVPLARAPDEAAHWEYIEHIATLRSLPIFSGAAPPSPGYEFHQPPLYYLLSAPLWALLGAGAQNYSARLIPLLCGALVVWLIVAAARALFGHGERGLAIARRAGMLGALWPLHLAVGSSSNNDALGGLCCAALFWRLALLAKQAPSVRDGLWIGALCGLGLLSKTTSLTVAVAAMLALWHLARRAFAAADVDAEPAVPAPSRTAAPEGKASAPEGKASAPSRRSARDDRQVLEEPRAAAAEPGRVLGVGVGVALLVCGWMLARNTMLYGDALALGAFKKAADAIGPGLAEFAAPRPVGLGLSAPGYGRNLLAILFATCWGFYGGPNSAIGALRIFSSRPAWPDGWLLGAALLLLAASTWVGVRGVALGSRVAGRLRAGRLRGGGSGRDWVLLWWGVAMLLVALAWLQFATAHFAGAQARYLHAALLPSCVLASRAWDDLPRPLRGPLGWALALVLLALTLANVFVWRTLV